MMTRVWVGTDLHIFNYSPDERHPHRSASNIDRVKQNYAADIDSGDLFMYLGDLCDPGSADIPYLKEMLGAIPGHKIMCKGNHDTETDAFYLDLGFDKVCTIAQIHSVLFSHKPIDPDLLPKDMINIHGHDHTRHRSGLDYRYINAYDPEHKDHPFLVDTLIDKAMQTKPEDEVDVVSKLPDKSQFTTDGTVLDLSDKVQLIPIDESTDENTFMIQDLNNVSTPEALLDWMKNNVHYANFTKLKTEIQIIKSKSGSCHDQVAFAYPRLRKMGKSARILFFISYREGEQTGGMTHSLVYWEDDGKTYWFENSWQGAQGIRKYDNLDALKKDIIARYKRMPSAQKFPELDFKTTSIAKFKPGITLAELVDSVYGEDSATNESVNQISNVDVYTNADLSDDDMERLVYLVTTNRNQLGFYGMQEISVIITDKAPDVDTILPPTLWCGTYLSSGDQIVYNTYGHTEIKWDNVDYVKFIAMLVTFRMVDIVSPGLDPKVRRCFSIWSVPGCLAMLDEMGVNIPQDIRDLYATIIGMVWTGGDDAVIQWIMTQGSNADIMAEGTDLSALDEILFSDTEDAEYWMNDDDYEPGHKKQEPMADGLSDIANEAVVKKIKHCPLVFLSQASDWGENVISPRIPDNYMTKNGYEDSTTPRVCFSTSIKKALRALSQKCEGMELYVYVPGGDYKVITPTTAQVPDVKLTDERWILEPVVLYHVGKIKVLGDAGGPGLRYTYGKNQSAELFDWNWKWLEKGGQDPASGETFIVNENADQPLDETPMASALSNDHEQNGKKSLSSFKRITIDDAKRIELSEKYKFMKHFYGNDEWHQTVGWLDRNGSLVAAICVSKPDAKYDGQVWLSDFEITKEYRGYGLSKQILNYACTTCGVDALGVAKDNEIARKVYEDYGFKYGKDVGKKKTAGTNLLMYLPESAVGDTIILVDPNDKDAVVAAMNLGYTWATWKNRGRMQPMVKPEIITETAISVHNKWPTVTVSVEPRENPNDHESSKGEKVTFYNKTKKPVGECSVSAIDTDNGFLYDLEVFPQYRGQGYANSIMSYMLSSYNVGELCVLKSNAKAINLYLKFGFTVNKTYQDNGHAMLDMKLTNVPKVLYHGSPDRHPKLIAYTSPAYPDVKAVYGTPSYDFALAYAGGQWSDLQINQSVYNGRHILTEILPGMFAQYFDRPGYIHYMNGASFIPHSRAMEYVCHHDVVPTKIEAVPNVLTALQRSQTDLYKYPDLPPFIKSRKEYIEKICGRWGIDAEKVMRDYSINEAAAETHAMERDEQNQLAAKYDLHMPGHTEEEQTSPKHKEKAEAQKRAEALREKRKKDLAKARRVKKRKTFVRKLKSKLPIGSKNEDTAGADDQAAEYYEPRVEKTVFGDRLYIFSGINSMENETAKPITETYQFSIADPNLRFMSSLTEAAASDDKTLYPVYIMLMHSGTLLASAIKAVTNSKFSHSSISFDSSMRNMYSFGRKSDTNPFIGAFKKEDIRDDFFKNRQIPYALYVVPCTAGEIELMKKRLNYFIQNSTKFKYDFTGLMKNYFGIADNPEYKWFCSRFVSDILNAGAPTEHPYVVEPSLMKPEDFRDTNFAIYVTGGYLDVYDKKTVDRLTNKILRVEKIRRAKQAALDKTLDVNPFDPLQEAVLGYHLAMMDESVVDMFLDYMRSFKVKFDKAGNVIITRREYDQLDSHFRYSLKMIKAYEKANNLVGVKDELCKIKYMIELINSHYLNPRTRSSDRVKADLRKEMMDLRSVMLNAFQQHLAYVTVREPQFNMQQYYNVSNYGSDMMIPKSVVTAVGKTLVTKLG